MNRLNRYLILGTIISVLTGTLAGCGGEAAIKPADNQEGTAISQGGIGTTSPGGIKGTGDNKPPREAPAFFGKVQSIIGNEVVLQLAKMPERPANSEGDAEQNREKPLQVSGASGEGAGPGGPPPGSGGNGSKRREMEFTGETKTITIPVGVPIVSRSRDKGETSLDIADIYAGVILQVWVNEAASITKVSVMQTGQSEGTSN